jgi:hypothetical protein
MSGIAERVLATRLAGCGARSPLDTARAVAGFFAAQTLPEGARAADYIDALAFFALSGAGEAEAAATWRQKFLPAAGWLDSLAPSRWSGGISYEAWALFASGALQLSREPWHGGGTLWRLDFARLGEKGRETLALALYPGLRGILAVLADGLEAAGGRGTVGLASLSQDGAAGGESAQNILAFCRRELEEASMARHWPHTPQAVLLDWIPAKHPPRA